MGLLLLVVVNTIVGVTIITLEGAAIRIISHQLGLRRQR